MEIKIRPLNKGEIFPCSIRSAKKVFSDTPVILNFAYTSRIYGTFSHTPPAYYLKNKINGTVIASSCIHPREKQILLSFFVLKETQYTDELRKEFESKYLLEFYKLYKEMLDNTTLNEKAILMLVELVDDKLKSHLINL